MVDDRGKLWLMELNHTPSLNMYEKTNAAEGDEELVVSDLDKELKVNLVQDTISILLNEYVPHTSCFE